MSYYLGIDGGGTKTTCAVGDELRLLVTSTAGPSNIVRVGETKARESLQKAVLEACTAAGITPGQIVRTCVGGAGAARPELAGTVQRFLAEILSTPIDVVGDMQTGLEAAFGDGPGVVVNAGTGSFAYGRNREGKTARAGGWGFAIGDEGSAQWIGRSAVNAVLRASDRGDRADARLTPLAESLCQAWGVGSLLDLAREANSIPPPNFAALAPAVFSLEDDVAKQILTSAAHELALIAEAVMRRLFTKAEVRSVPVAMIGGVFRHALLVREVFYNELRQFDARAEVNPNVVDPVEGALRMARKAASKS